ncbi:MAG: hypothetical protein KDA96_13415 [Planctomycetaceae bacterium]|nr:hypothetical protein [Planctomycetaceae bacterium]
MTRPCQLFNSGEQKTPGSTMADSAPDTILSPARCGLQFGGLIAGFEDGVTYLNRFAPNEQTLVTDSGIIVTVPFYADIPPTTDRN